jgi:uncharacterized iron-regulated membrane protein/flavodoxin
MNVIHKIIFWSHLTAGVVAGTVIFLMSATGVILMYERQLLDYVERDVRQVVPPAAATRLSLDELVTNAREQHPSVRPISVVLRNERTTSVAIGFGREGTVYMNPYSGAVLGTESHLQDWFHDVTDWHRWLGREGEGRATARAITGACNLAFFWLAITGVYLWWPRSWHWRGLKSSLLINPRLRGKARDWNWHNVIGFWSSTVLVVLTLTAAVMSYPWANDLLYTLTGSEPPPRAQGPGPQTVQRRVAGEARERKSMASFDDFFARAEQQAPGWVMMVMRLPSGDGPVTLLIQEPPAPHMFARSQLTLNGSTAELVNWEPYTAANTGRKLRVWVRGLHTGEALGFVGQTVAGLASLGGCFLVWTGLAMAWRRFRYRNRDVEDVTTLVDVATPAEAQPILRSSVSQISHPAQEATVADMQQVTNAINEYTHNGFNQATVGGSGASIERDSALVLYGTVTGNAERLAKKLAGKLRVEGIAAQVLDMACCEPRVLTRANCVLMVISTYGDGEPPEDAAPFWEGVVHGSGLDLRGVRFSVLALGNTTYDQFCKCGRDLDAAMERHGAIRLFPRIDCDAIYDDSAAHWLEGVLASLKEIHRPALSA